ncbi:MAG: sulfate permease [Verrucomicrobiia bacterium]
MKSLTHWFYPALWKSLQHYSFKKFGTDLIAGLSVGIIALPLAIAFGIASGVKPEQGLYTAIIAGFLISFFGGSRVQIGGPTGAFVVIVYGIIQKYGYANLVICTIMAGIILVGMGLLKMGTLIKYIPQPVTTGFTSGIAVIIALVQVKDFLGLKMGVLPADFFEKIQALSENISTLHFPTVCIGISSLALLFILPRFVSYKIPASLLIMILGTLAVVLFKIPLETIGTRFGEVPNTFPQFAMPDLSLNHLANLISPAFTIAILAAIESLLSAVVADGIIQDHHDSNTELIAQGIANITVPFFGGIPATGAIARTVANIENNAQSPVAGIIHALTLLFIMLIAAPLAKFVPLVVLSAILLRVAYNMGEWEEFKRLHRIPKSDAAVFLTTFILTVVFDLTIAVEIGMILAAVLFIKKVSDNTQIVRITPETEAEGAHHSIHGKTIPEGVMIYDIYGTFFFGAAEKMEHTLQTLNQLPKILILRMHRVTVMDATALYALEVLVEKMIAQHNHVILSAPHTQPYFMMTQAGFIEKMGHDFVAVDLDDALKKAEHLLIKPTPEI